MLHYIQKNRETNKIIDFISLEKYERSILNANIIIHTFDSIQQARKRPMAKNPKGCEKRQDFTTLTLRLAYDS